MFNRQGSRAIRIRSKCFRTAVHAVFGLEALLAAGEAVAKEESAARALAAQALAFRAAVVAGEESAMDVLAAMPGSGMVGRDMLPALWGPSFANSIVKLGRLDSSGPVALYYDPLLDVAVIAFWIEDGGAYRMVSARALPGERLAEPDAEAPLSPPWLSAEGGLVGALSRTARARVGAFSRGHPADGRERARDSATFAAAAADMRVVLARLIRNAQRRARWTDRARPWLKPALTEAEKLLDVRDPAVLRTAAPDTDEESAVALAALPDGYAGRLALDMTLALGETDRLLIGSSAGDGDIYVLVLCRLSGPGLCDLRRFLLISLLE